MPVDTPAWARDAVFYQVFPDRFANSPRVPKPGPLEPWDAPPTWHGFKGGDLRGIVDRLDELDDLGVTALYLTPVFASASNHRYHAYDYHHVDPLLGGNEALRELIDALHARGMRIILDGVLNHCGRGFWPFHHVAEAGGSSPYAGWFHLDEEVRAGRRGLAPYPGPSEEAEQHRRLAEGMWAGEASRRTYGYEGWWGLPALPKLNTDHPEARAYLLDVAERWLRFGIDGWRLDVAEEIDDGFWEEFRRRCRAVNPDAYLVAEVWYEKPSWLTGLHFDALMNYPLGEAILGYAGGDTLDVGVAREHDAYGRGVFHRDAPSLAGEIERLVRLYDPDVTNVMLNLLGSHDTPRIRTVLGGDLDALRMATLLQLALPGAPCIYYGDEIGMEGHHDPGNRGGYPPVLPGGAEGAHRDFVRAAIRLRRNHRALRDGATRIAFAEGMTLGILRTEGPEAFLVVVNPGRDASAPEIVLPDAHGTPIVAPLPGWEEGPERGADWTPGGRLRVRVPGRSGIVVRLHAGAL